MGAGDLTYSLYFFLDHSLCHKSSLSRLEVGVEWMLRGAVDVNLVEHVEGDVVLLDEILDLGIAARLLKGSNDSVMI